MPHTITGWLFDAYPSPHGMTLWFVDLNGDKHQCNYKFAPSFFLHLNEADRKRAGILSRQCPVAVTLKETTRQELFSGECLDVVQVLVHDPTRLRSVVAFYEKFFPHFAFYNSDILPEQLFLYAADLFVLGFGEYRLENNELVEWTLHDSRDAVEYNLPPLRSLLIRNAHDFIPPKYQRTLQLEISYDDRTYVIEQDTPREVLESLNWHLYSCDPDIILTEYGDSVLLPKLTALAKQYNVPLLLNRDQMSGYKTTKESSFFQYGKVVHKDGAFEVRGRWHVDVNNSFAIVESNLAGLFELVRVTQLCPQHQARASIGTGLSSLQLSWAYRHNVLIPAKKREPEEFKSASTLLLADRGGLIYMPPLGYHEDVAELDFVSMYPSIMVNQNVSPETVNCRCCNNTNVPELGYTICEKREGIVPATLRAIVRKRAYYKTKKREHKGKNDVLYQMYESRQNALKWMLVSCFGYLGYKNARFGRIEAHESVNAFSRDAILTAKEIAERRGFNLVHAIIDCVWLRKQGATEQEYHDLCRAISSDVGIDISLEGIYRWIVFPASKRDSEIPTGTRYAGVYRHDELKIRGLETRRHDTTRFVKKMQGEMLEQMSKAHTIAAVEAMVPALLEIVREYVVILQRGSANPMELVIRRRITKEADEYMNHSISASVTKMLQESGIRLAAGESIEYIIVDAKGKSNPEKAKPVSLYALEDGYDIEKYSELLLDAAATLLEPFGYNFEKLQQMYGMAKPKRRRIFLPQLFETEPEAARLH